MNPDILGPFLNVICLAEYGCRLAAAKGEIDTYCELLEGTTALLSHTKASRINLSAYLTTEERKRFDEEFNRTELALDRARKVVSRSYSSGPKGKRIRWMFKDKDAAQAYKEVLAQRHATLVGINLEMAMVSHLRPPHVQQPSPRVLDLLVTRHARNSITEAEEKAWSLAPRRDSDLASIGSETNAWEERHAPPFTLPAPPIVQLCLPISAAPPPDATKTPGGRVSETELFPWLLKKHKPQ